MKWIPRHLLQPILAVTKILLGAVILFPRAWDWFLRPQIYHYRNCVIAWMNAIEVQLLIGPFVLHLYRYAKATAEFWPPLALKCSSQNVMTNASRRPKMSLSNSTAYLFKYGWPEKVAYKITTAHFSSPFISKNWHSTPNFSDSISFGAPDRGAQKERA